MQATSPSSSTTTPSPSLPFLQPPGTNASSIGSITLQLADLEPQERDERQRAVKKFLARAECSKLTRSLRARLAYASYKATNNLSHVSLPDLEHRIHTPVPSPAPSPSPVPAPTSPYLTQKRRADVMPPPASPSRSLYSSLLGPPPSKRPRHFYGPVQSSVSASSGLLPSYSPATPSRKKSSSSPRRAPASPFVNGGQGRTVRTVLQGRARSTVTEKEDMNAAATLTALMFNRASPRQQRHEEGGVSRTSSGTSILAPPRTSTPGSEPKPTEDADAAELMLYLATSPSPARPTTRRAVSGMGMGRVLFAGAAKGGDKEPGTDRDTTPGLTASQSSLPSSQDTITSQLLPPPPSPSLARSPLVDPANAKRPLPFDVSRRLFDSDDAHRIAELREEGGGTGRFGTVEGLGKGIDLVEAKFCTAGP